MVEEVNFFGSGGGRAISPCLHAHSTMVDFKMEEKPSRTLHSGGRFTTLPTTVKNTHALAIRVPSITVHSHAEGFFPVFHLHAQDFAGCTHAVVLFCRFVNSEAVSFTHGLICGFCIVVDTHTGHETVNWSPLWSAYVFPSSIGCAKWVIVPHVIGNMYADVFLELWCFPPVGIVFVVVFGTV